EEIDRAIIPTYFRELVVDPFYGTQDLHVHLQAFQTQVYISGGDDVVSSLRTIHTFNDLAMTFVSQFATNKAKKLEVANMFDINQAKGRVALGRSGHGRPTPSRARTTLVRNQSRPRPFRKTNPSEEETMELSPIHSLEDDEVLDPKGGLPHPPLGSSRDEWCEFHCTCGHTTKGCRNLKSQIEKLIRTGYLSRFMQTQGTITTISKGEAITQMMTFERKRYANSVMTVQASATHPKDPYSFSDDDYEGMISHQDDPMIISVVAVEFKVEKVLVDQESSTNILYWATFPKDGTLKIKL
ncbi:hypothetical protein CR513_58164, partial [Mucuna pruriens]